MCVYIFKRPQTSAGDGLKDVCVNEECLKKRNESCDKIIEKCGHNCIGVRGETECIGCLNKQCVPENATNSNEFCNICWVEPLLAAPCIQLECGHIFHFRCVWHKINHGWHAARYKIFSNQLLFFVCVFFVFFENVYGMRYICTNKKGKMQNEHTDTTHTKTKQKQNKKTKKNTKKDNI